MTKSTWRFDLGTTVKIDCSGERGHVVARSESLLSAPQYLVRYKANDGRAVEAWWQEDALSQSGPDALPVRHVPREFKVAR